MFLKLLTFLVVVFWFLFLARPSFAVTVTINSYPSMITDQPFIVNVSVSGASAGTNYLRIDLFKEQTVNYFGETYNGADFYGASTYTQYFPVAILSGVTWTGEVQGRIGSPTLTQFDASGSYKLRIRRYTSGGGNTAAEANDGAVAISISVPSPTPTPTPIVSSSPSLNPTLTITLTPTPTKVPIVTPSTTVILSPVITKKLTLSPTPQNIPKEENSISLAEDNSHATDGILGLADSKISIVEVEDGKKLSLGKYFIAGGLILIGFVFLVLAGYSFLHGSAKSNKGDSDTMSIHGEDS